MIRVGFLGVAHLHSESYIPHLGDSLTGIYDHDSNRALAFSEKHACQSLSKEDLLAQSDALIICSENMRHADDIIFAAKAGKPVLCEKPIAATLFDLDRIEDTIEECGTLLMTAFPCPYSPIFNRALARIKNGDIGKILAINATNRGRCPFEWFVQTELSGGGAMIDHTVHVADLLLRLLGESPQSVVAQIGSNMYGEEWEDTAHLTLHYKSGVFATLDSSWSRPKNYKTWGDVTLEIIGSQGVIEADLFGQGVSLVSNSYKVSSTGSDLNLVMLQDFLDSVVSGTEPKATGKQGIQAAKIAIAGYQSVQNRCASSVA